MYKLPSNTSTDLKLRLKGTDGRQWILVDWQVVYDGFTPDETMVYENYVPAEADADKFLTEMYGPWNIGPTIQGKAISQVRTKNLLKNLLTK